MYPPWLWTRTLSLLAAAVVAGACASGGGNEVVPLAAKDTSRARAHHSVGATHLREGRHRARDPRAPRGGAARIRGTRGSSSRSPRPTGARSSAQTRSGI